MSIKHEKCVYPNSRNPDDFQCFGPAAERDGEFNSVKICDMGCFNQSGKDTNKYFHAAIVKDKHSGEWYAYFEWGRTGGGKPQFQFIQCNSENEAQKEFADKLHSKNDKRGQWVTIAGINTLQAKPGKDCYLVRPQATRSTGLPDARTIKSICNVSKAKSNGKIDSITLKLMQSLNVATISYTKGSMADSSLPTKTAIDEARQILLEAQKRLSKVGDNLQDQVSDDELIQLTSLMYGRIPKKKHRNADSSTWILSRNNIFMWQQDLDAFESALYAGNDGQDIESPFGDMQIEMNHINKEEELGKFLYQWWPKATRNRHAYLSNQITPKYIWKINRLDEKNKFENKLNILSNEIKKEIEDRPFHQLKNRSDLSKQESSLYWKTNTNLLFHGTRSVNILGLMREGFRFPKELVGVTFSGSNFGSGAYFADDIKKSIGYTSYENSYWARGGGAVSGRGAFMFICDVALGLPHLAPSTYAYVGPPKGNHSIFAKCGFTSRLENNEFIIFSKDQIKIRYLVEFN